MSTRVETIPNCACCCPGNCDDPNCDNVDSSCSGEDLYEACAAVPDNIPVNGCGDKSVKRDFSPEASTLNLTVGACIKNDGNPCFGGEGPLIRDTYFRLVYKNTTTRCMTFFAHLDVSGLESGCTLQVANVTFDPDFQWPLNVTSDGTYQFNGHCAAPCSETEMCFAFRIIGPCGKCMDETATVTNFKWSVECVDDSSCNGDPGCVAVWSCQECCECCMTWSHPMGFSEQTGNQCCGNQVGLLDSGQYSCSPVGPDCSAGSEVACSHTAPSTIVVACDNYASGNCVFVPTVFGDPYFNYPCNCGYDGEEVTCTPAGRYYKGVDQVCENDTEPCMSPECGSYPM